MHTSKVDSEYLVGTRAKGGFPTRWAPKGHLAIPHGLLMTGIQPTTDLSHPRIPENVKVIHLKPGRNFLVEIAYLCSLVIINILPLTG